MSIFVIITLNSPVGADVGPVLTLTADVGVVTPNTATVTELLAGVLVELDSAATQVTITDADGPCEIVIPFTVPTTTTTTTTTTTICPCNTYEFTGNNLVVSFEFTPCNESTSVIIGLSAGQSQVYCVNNAYPITMIGDGNYSLRTLPEICCTDPIPCKCYTVTNLEVTDGILPYRITYYDCDNLPQLLLIPKETSANVCALENTIVPNFVNTIVDNGECSVDCTTTTTTTLFPCTCIMIESLEISSYEYKDCNGDTQTGTVTTGSPLYVCGDFDSTVPYAGTKYTDNGPCIFSEFGYQCPPL